MTLPLHGRRAVAAGLAALILGSFSGQSLFVHAQPAAQEVTLNLLNQGEPDNFDPNRDANPGSGAISRQLFEPLLRFDQKLIPQPAAASSYEVSADGTVYTFHLRADGHWNDGATVTAQQFEYSWKRILDPQLSAPYAPLFVDAGIIGADDYASGRTATPDRVGVQALDELTLQIRLVQPFAALPALAALWVVPPLRPEIVSSNLDGWAEDPSTYAGNGPFMISEWVHQDHITLVPNPNYTAHGGWPRPALTRATVLMIQSSAADLQAFESDRRDWLLVADEDVNQVLNQPALAMMSRQYNELTSYWVGINTAHPPLDDVNVRRALTRAIDRTQLIRETAGGIGMPLTSIIPPGMAGAQPQLGAELGFDPIAARSLLAQAASADGGSIAPHLGLSFPATAATQREAELLRAQWQRQLGIDVELRGLDDGSYAQALQDKTYDLALGGRASDYPDPQAWLATLFSCGGRHNAFNYCDSSFDQLVARADTGSGFEDRLRLYGEAQAKLMQAVPVAPLYARGHLVLVKPWVQSIDGGPLPISAQDDYPGSSFLDRVQIVPH